MKIKELVETTTSGGIATVAMPLGKTQKRKNPSIYNEDDAVSFKYDSPKSREDYLRMKKELFKLLSDPMAMGDPQTKSVVQRYIIKLNTEAEELGYR